MVVYNIREMNEGYCMGFGYHLLYVVVIYVMLNNI